MSELKNLNIAITGDIVYDHHIIEGNKKLTSDKNNGTVILTKVGGAFLTFELIDKVIKNTSTKLSQKIGELQNDLIKPENEYKRINIEGKKAELEYQESFFTSFLKINTEIREDFSDNDTVSSYAKWTFDEKQNIINPGYIGFGNTNSKKSIQEQIHSAGTSTEADLVVIDEANLGYRNSNIDFTDKNVILKMSYPFCKGPLWQNLTEKAKNLITIVNLRNLRNYDAKVSKGISWEQTALDLAFELVTNIHLKKLLNCNHLIISIGSAGALYVKNGDSEEKAEFHLIFDPIFMEDEWEEKNGSSIGLGSAFLAGFIKSYINEYYSFTTNKKNIGREYFANDIKKLIKTGLNFTRSISKSGLLFYDKEKESDQILKKIDYSVLPLTESGEENPCYYSTAFVPSPYWKSNENKEINAGYLKNNYWNILEGNYFPKETTMKRIHENNDLLNKINIGEKEIAHEIDTSKPYYDLAREVALNGPSAIQYAPKIQFGGFTSFDRNEIESLRNIRKLMLEYQSDKDIKRPLNIAIFGAPGAGKSFAVKQIAKNAMGACKIQLLEFNLSQFAEPSELSGAFHEIRDAVLRGEFPVVFWDEFDSEGLKWLKEFITPMQDGFFQEAGRSHPLGKCIFFFAGGTGNTFESFNPEFFEDSNSDAESELVKKFRLLKGPDFLSRIDGYLNVLGPNRKEIYNKSTRNWEEDKTDVCFPVRRALFLYGNLKSKNEDKIKIDWGLMSAFLEVGKYIRGSRSFERLLHQVKLYNPSKYVRSNLPSDEVIAMNVDYNEFISLLYKDREIEKFSEKVAPYIHAAWMGFNVNESTFFNNYSQLNYEGRKNNISAAVRMFKILKNTKEFEIGLSDDTKPISDADFDTFIDKKENLEELAKLEHNGWLTDRVRDGWKLHYEKEGGKDRNDYLKSHSCIVQYHDLDENQKNKDRDSIRNYSKFLMDSNFAITKASQM